MKKLPILVDKKIVYVDYQTTNNKNMYLKISGENNIVVSAPRGISEDQVTLFVKKHIRKFLSHIDKSKLRQLYSLKNNFIFLEGKKYKIVYLTGFLRAKAHLENGILYLQTLKGENTENDKLIKSILLKETKKYIMKTQYHFERIMGVPTHRSKFIYKVSTWGTNNIKLMSISYSTKLAHFSNDVKDYLIVHELSHYQFHSHNQDFWHNVQKYCPNYKEIQKKMLHM